MKKFCLQRKLFNAYQSKPQFLANYICFLFLLMILAEDATQGYIWATSKAALSSQTFVFWSSSEPISTTGCVRTSMSSRNWKVEACSTTFPALCGNGKISKIEV